MTVFVIIQRKYMPNFKSMGPTVSFGDMCGAKFGMEHYGKTIRIRKITIGPQRHFKWSHWWSNFLKKLKPNRRIEWWMKKKTVNAGYVGPNSMWLVNQTHSVHFHVHQVERLSVAMRFFFSLQVISDRVGLCHQRVRRTFAAASKTWWSKTKHTTQSGFSMHPKFTLSTSLVAVRF